MSLAVTMTSSSHGMSPPNTMFVILPRAEGLRTVAPWSISRNDRSSTYSAWPVTFLRPSLRGNDLPMGRCSDILTGLWPHDHEWVCFELPAIKHARALHALFFPFDKPNLQPK